MKSKSKVEKVNGKTIVVVPLNPAEVYTAAQHGPWPVDVWSGSFTCNADWWPTKHPVVTFDGPASLVEDVASWLRAAGFIVSK